MLPIHFTVFQKLYRNLFEDGQEFDLYGVVLFIFLFLVKLVVIYRSSLLPKPTRSFTVIFERYHFLDQCQLTVLAEEAKQIMQSLIDSIFSFLTNDLN